MSKQAPTQTGLSRRTALAGVLALAGSAAPALAAPVEPDDAELLRVVQAGLEADAAFCQLSEAWADEIDTPPHVEAQEHALVDALSDKWDEAGSLQAHTLVGLQAKARLALTAMPLNRNRTVSPGAPDYLMWSLCRDLLGVAA
ncbi:hypothetical protein OQ496_11510 [Acetobacter suratthaniensis]|uniref:Uncharacterized protein n=1 Tax=Acetobacter suratthaniensis TaxID=1502841 RepID=A0ABS3LNH2_9PROT|nr:hypothetical protein [Acetobacter suratthaniensis]MBO1328929.1 hypothetical protein [Acetobacter suratthaniensis]MCX2567078.1 hypothetical protein [Acetobacter suratthaniensis]